MKKQIWCRLLKFDPCKSGKLCYQQINLIVSCDIYFRFKDAKKLRELSVFAITQLLPSRKGDNLFIRAKLVQDTLKVFFSSADRTISLDHTPTQRMNDNGLRVYIEVDKRQVFMRGLGCCEFGYGGTVLIWTAVSQLNHLSN